MLTLGQHYIKQLGPSSLLNYSSVGNTISYRDTLQIDTLAEKNMDHDKRSVVPPNLVAGRFVHFSADNIDINDGTLDGKDTFHATQIAAWQREPAPDNLLADIKPSKHTTLKVPEAMGVIIPANIGEGTSQPLTREVQTIWFDNSNDTTPSTLRAAVDMAFMCKHQHENPRHI